MKATVVGVIPARYASQRLPAKALVDLLGKTMVQRVYEQAACATSLNRVVVATDDARIASVVNTFGGEVVMTSPDIKTGSDRVAAVAEQIAGDVFVNIQGDEPLIAPQMIDQGVEVLLSDERAAVGTLAKKIETVEELLNPNVVKVILDAHQYGIYFSRSTIPSVRDEADARRWLSAFTFLKHIGIYVFRKESLRKFTSWQETDLERTERLEQLRFLHYGERIKVGITPFDSIPIDTQEDVVRVLNILKNQRSGSSS